MQHGCLLFRDYCLQQESHAWEEVTLDSAGRPIVVDRLGNKRALSPRIENQMRIMVVHGEIPADVRTGLIRVFNSKDNAQA